MSFWTFNFAKESLCHEVKVAVRISTQKNVSAASEFDEAFRSRTVINYEKHIFCEVLLPMHILTLCGNMYFVSAVYVGGHIEPSHFWFYASFSVRQLTKY